MKEDLLEEVKSTINIYYKMIEEAEHEVIYVGKSDLKLLVDYTTNLEKRNKEIYEGFMATQEELTEYATENERLHSIIKEVREHINKRLNINSDYIDYDYGTELLRQELLEILDKVEE